jgi:hypothetical protein
MCVPMGLASQGRTAKTVKICEIGERFSSPGVTCVPIGHYTTPIPIVQQNLAWRIKTMAKSTPKKTVHRSSESGKFVKPGYAKTHPRTTETERVSTGGKKK